MSAKAPKGGHVDPIYQDRKRGREFWTDDDGFSLRQRWNECCCIPIQVSTSSFDGFSIPVVRQSVDEQGAELAEDVGRDVARSLRGDHMGSAVNIVVNALDKTTGALTPSPPSRAYLIGSNLVSNERSLIESGASDTPGGWYSVNQFSPTVEIVLDGMKQNKLIVAFNQQSGKTDIALPLELDVISTNPDGTKVRSNKTESEFAQCVSSLIEQGRSQQ